MTQVLRVEEEKGTSMNKDDREEALSLSLSCALLISSLVPNWNSTDSRGGLGSRAKRLGGGR